MWCQSVDVEKFCELALFAVRLFYAVFSEEVHLRVQEHEDFRFGRFVSPNRVTSVTPAHFLVFVLFVWGLGCLVGYWELKLTSF